MDASKKNYVQTFGKKKTSVATCLVRKGKGSIKVNGSPIDLLKPEILRYKVYEPVLLVGSSKFQNLDFKIKVSGGGWVSRVYAIRQALARGLIAYYQKFVDEQQKKELKEILVSYDRSLLVSDPRRAEPKKFGGVGARSKIQKSYR